MRQAAASAPVVQAKGTCGRQAEHSDHLRRCRSTRGDERAGERAMRGTDYPNEGSSLDIGKGSSACLFARLNPGHLNQARPGWKAK